MRAARAGQEVDGDVLAYLELAQVSFILSLKPFFFFFFFI